MIAFAASPALPAVPPAPVTFRIAKEGDGLAIAQLQDLANEKQLSQSTWAGKSAVWDTFGARQIESGATEMALANTLVAERGEVVVGMLNFVHSEGTVGDDPPDPISEPFIALRQALGRCIYLRAMAVLPEARGTGVATRMLDLAEDVANRERLALGVIVHDTNAELIEHYQRRGYRRVLTAPVREHATYPVGSTLIALRRGHH